MSNPTAYSSNTCLAGFITTLQEQAVSLLSEKLKEKRWSAVGINARVTGVMKPG